MLQVKSGTMDPAFVAVLNLNIDDAQVLQHRKCSSSRLAKVNPPTNPSTYSSLVVI
jgi:hypothetical protein